MKIFLVIIIVIFIYLYFHEHKKVLLYEEEIAYIGKKIKSIVGNHEGGYILIPTENELTKDLVVDINNLVDVIYQEKRESIVLKKNIDMVLTNVSHDLKTPLTILKGYIEILYNNIKNLSDGYEMFNILGKLHEKTEETIRMLNQFFSMAKIESGDMIIKLENTDISRILKEIMLEFYDLLEGGEYEVHIEIPEKPVYAMIDEDAFKRILNNLIDNSIKHGSEGKYLGVSIEEKDKCVNIDIEDHGKGITSEDRKFIFDRAYTLENNKGNYEGSGLGLSISRKMAIQMNIDIDFFSNPGIPYVVG
ncbi:MAG: sensor histidine kinase [Senegalia sp. (in: firmicutes)]